MFRKSSAFPMSASQNPAPSTSFSQSFNVKNLMEPSTSHVSSGFNRSNQVNLLPKSQPSGIIVIDKDGIFQTYLKPQGPIDQDGAAFLVADALEVPIARILFFETLSPQGVLYTVLNTAILNVQIDMVVVTVDLLGVIMSSGGYLGAVLPPPLISVQLPLLLAGIVNGPVIYKKILARFQLTQEEYITLVKAIAHVLYSFFARRIPQPFEVSLFLAHLFQPYPGFDYRPMINGVNNFPGFIFVHIDYLVQQNKQIRSQSAFKIFNALLVAQNPTN